MNKGAAVKKQCMMGPQKIKNKFAIGHIGPTFVHKSKRNKSKVSKIFLHLFIIRNSQEVGNNINVYWQKNGIIKYMHIKEYYLAFKKEGNSGIYYMAEL